MSSARDYSKLTLYQQILKRPETYVGSTQPIHGPQWIFEKQTMNLQESMRFVPAFLKIFDEIAVNAADNSVRHENTKTIKFEFDTVNNSISVYNDGHVPPIEKHPVHKSFVPSMIFGELLTSNNYDDTQQRITGGRNGFGAKLTNMFSMEFTVDIVSAPNNRIFHQTWTNNMLHTEGPQVQYKKAAKSWIKITWKPDLEKLSMQDGIHNLVWGLLRRRVYDIAGTTHKRVKVFLDNELVPIKSFGQYAKLFCPNAVGIDLHERWDVAIAPKPNLPIDMLAPTFVNNIRTNRGGTHVAASTNAFFKHVQESLFKKVKTAKKLRPADIRNQCWVFVNARVVNPVFGGQQKDELTSKASMLGSKPSWPVNALKKASSVVMPSLVEWATLKTQAALSKSVGKSKKMNLNIDKYEGAHKAGGTQSNRCTLILTEGDSAKALAVAGLSVIGRDLFGVFPLRGKMINTRTAPLKKVIENKEVKNVMKILGLTPGSKDYSHMRYGHLMIMTDQDVDGSHIKGLIMNMIDFYFPELLQREGFLQVFRTPIVKASRGSQCKSFYSIPEFKQWESQTADASRWKIKYYKGLGTSTTKEAKEYFRNLATNKIVFKPDQTQRQKLEMAFHKDFTKQRKDCTQHVPEDAGLIQPDTITTFVDKELILFWGYDNIRSIPSVMDGFKPAQRKALYGLLRKDSQEIKVAQAAAYVAETTNYHHGEVSLGQTIVGMAQNFVGSNNINLLEPIGQFGTRLRGGKDAASVRYIFTKLSGITKRLFCDQDTPLLVSQKDENKVIEPMWYAPILPMILVNGACGIGTGWSTDIPMYNAEQLRDIILSWLDTESLPTNIQPWVKDFKGNTTMTKEKVIFEGTVRRVGVSCNYHITELPVGKWTQKYKDDLYKLEFVSKIKENSTESKVDMVVTTTQPVTGDLLDKFKLRTSTSLTNMIAFDEKGALKHFSGPIDILQYWLPKRLALYEKRRQHLISVYKQQRDEKKTRLAFIKAIKSKTINIDADNIEQLVQQTFGVDPKLLLSMPLSSMNQRRMDSLNKSIEETQRMLVQLRSTTSKEMWKNDLSQLFKRGVKRGASAQETSSLKKIKV